MEFNIPEFGTALAWVSVVMWLLLMGHEPTGNWAAKFKAIMCFIVFPLLFCLAFGLIWAIPTR